MDSRGIRRELNKFENKYPVYEWKVGEFYVWPYLRFQIGATLITQGKMEKSGGFLSSPRRYIRSFLSSLWASLRDFNKNEKVSKCDYLFWENGVHSASINGEIYHARTDPLIEKLKERNYSVRKILVGNKYETPRKIKSLFVQPRLNFILISASFRYRSLQLKPPMRLTGYENFLKDIEKLGIDSRALSKGSLRRNVYIMSRYKEYFKKLLSKFKPKALFMVCYYSTPGFAMISACKELSIPVVDIQHGIQGDYHYAYGSWGNYSLTREQSVLPDIFYVWGEQEAESIRKWKADSMKVFIGGNDYLKIWQFGKDPQIQSYIDNVKSKYNLSNYEKVILYTLGGFDAVDESIVQAIMDSPDNWLWIIRMHPKKTDVVDAWKGRLKDARGQYLIEGMEKTPLYLLMKVSDIHVTERSSTVMEAQEFGLHSVVTDPESPILYESYLNSGNTVFAESSGEILNYIKKLGKSNVDFKENKDSNIDRLLEVINNI